MTTIEVVATVTAGVLIVLFPALWFGGPRWWGGPKS